MGCVRAAMHQAGAAALTQLLQFAAPAADQRAIPCPCGQQAHYRELRSKPDSTAVGEVEVSRPYYLCPHCHQGPVSRRCRTGHRKHGVLSRGAPHAGAGGPGGALRSWPPADETTRRPGGDHQSRWSARRKPSERISPQREQEEIQQAVQLDLPVVVGKPIPILYVQMDGTGVPVVKKETVGRQGKTDGQPAHTREVKLGCVFTQTTLGRGRLSHPRSGFDHLHRRHRDRRRVWQAHLSGSLEARLEPRGKESRHGRRRRMDLESGRPAFSRRGADRRSLSRAPAPVGTGTQAIPQRRSATEGLDEDPPEAPARQGENRKAGARASLHPNQPIPK